MTGLFIFIGIIFGAEGVLWLVSGVLKLMNRWGWGWR